MKRVFFTGFFLWLVFILGIAVSQNTRSENQKPRDFELVFFQENNGQVFYNSTGPGVSPAAFKKLPDSGLTADLPDGSTDGLEISKLQYNSGQLYLTVDGGDLWKLDLPGGSLLKFSDAVKKPVDYQDGLKRSIAGFDQKTGLVLYDHEIVNPVVGISGQSANLAIHSNFSSSERFTSIASDRGRVYIGTAVNGLYYSTGVFQGKKGQNYLHFVSMNAGLPFIPFEGRVRFYEEIHTLHVSARGDVIAGTGIEGGVYLKKASGVKFEALPWPAAWKTSDVYLITSGGNHIWASCTQGLVIYTKEGDGYRMQNIPWEDFSYSHKTFLLRNSKDANLYAHYVRPNDKVAADKEGRMKTASSKRLFYSSPYNLRVKPTMIKSLLSDSHYDGIVLDVKDDRGQVLYNSSVPFVHEIGAAHPVMNLPEVIKMVHGYGKYIAVRIVVFKDPVLFEQPGFAIFNSESNQPWVGNEKERWIDPFNPEVAGRYMVPLVRELTAMGVDEIQFDYIRFPSDGPIYQCLFRHRSPGKYFSEAIEDFLFKVRQATPRPISLDIYGYQGLYRTGGAIGQDMVVLGRFSDVISPMLYSSHFGNEYMTDRKKEDRVYELIRHSIRRAEFIAADRFLIRPYLQAFSMKNNIWGYGPKYFLDQVRANDEERGSGYSFWGTIENMRAVDEAVGSLK